MTQHEGRRPGAAIGLLLCLAFQAVSGIYGGASLTATPDGRLLQMPISWLERTPLPDFHIAYYGQLNGLGYQLWGAANGPEPQRDHAPPIGPWSGANGSSASWSSDIRQ